MSASVHEASSVVQTSSNPPKVDRENRNRLVVENLPLVGYLVSDICRRASHLSRDDLSSTGALALITAAEAYDPTLGVPFGAFARRRIVGAFADEMRSNDWATRSVRRRIKETLGVRETLTHALGRFPSVDEIAKAMGVDRESAEAALSDASRTVTALEDSAADLKAADVLSPEDSLLAAEKTMFVHEAVAALPGKMRYIIEQIYFEDRSIKDLAEELGTTHSAVSQQRSEAIRMLHDGLTVNYLEGQTSTFVPKSRVSSTRLNSYLEAVSERTSMGVKRDHATPAWATA